MQTPITYIKNPRLLGTCILEKFFKWLPDSIYLRIQYYLIMEKRLNLKNPKTYQEKLQWLKLNDRKEIYHKMVEKADAKSFAKDIIGEEYIIPTYGIYDSFDDIDFNKLPNEFVLKTTHSGGNSGVVICRDKSTLDQNKAKSIINNSLNQDSYKVGKEWPYQNIPRRIIAEELLHDPNATELTDYKFFCFDGYVDCVMVCLDRQTSEETKYYFFDKDWKFLRINHVGLKESEDFTLPEPPNMKLMCELAAKLSKGLPSIRIDLYNINGKIYFGEFTFFSNAGFDRDLLDEAEERWGKLLDIESLK